MTPIPKYLDRHWATGWPRLLIWKDKHSTNHYLIENKEELLKESLAILKTRVKIGYISEPDATPYGYDKAAAEFDVSTLPEAMRANALAAKNNSLRSLKYHTEEVEQWARVQKALKDEDGVLAWIILDERSDAEYENIELESFENRRGK